MQEKPNSTSKVFGALTRQLLVTSPGRPPAAVITVSFSPAASFTAWTTCAYVGTGALLGAWCASSRASHSLNSALACAICPGSTRHEPSSPSSSVMVSSASPTNASARCFTASNRAALIEMKRASGLNDVHEPVVKSIKRVPTARITSASPASVFADVDPMIPIGPACAGWSWVTLPLPAIVSTIGMPCLTAKSPTTFSARE